MADDKPEVADENQRQEIDAYSTDYVPNGGLRAWLQVLGSFFLFFNSWGIINSFGVFQTYYETEILAQSSPSAIGWIGSIQVFLLLFIGSLTGTIYDAGYFRALVLVGTFLITFGTMMLSICSEYYQVLLAQAICIGLGCGCLFVPSVAILSTYFSTRIALAVGISASGSSLGGVIYPILLYKLVPEIGFGWATRVLGFFALGTLLIPLSVMKVRVLPSQRRGLLDLGAFRHLPYTIFVLGGFIGFMGLYTPFVYIQLYDISAHLTSPDLVFYLVPILNAASIFGRTIPNFYADHLGPLNVMVPFALISGLVSICLIPVNSTGGLVTICILYGFFSGTFVSLTPAVLVSLSLDRSKIGTHAGMAFSIISVGLLLGTPVAGAIQDSAGYASVWVFSGVLCMSGGVIMFAARCLKTNWIIWTKC